jgi:hypothetical protein
MLLVPHKAGKNFWICLET